MDAIWIAIPFILAGYVIGYWFYVRPLAESQKQDEQILNSIQKTEYTADTYVFAANPEWYERYRKSHYLVILLYAFIGYGLPSFLLYTQYSKNIHFPNWIIWLMTIWTIIGTWLVMKSWKQSVTLFKLSEEQRGKELLLDNIGIQVSILILSGVPGRIALQKQKSSTTVSWDDVASVTFEQIRFGGGSPVKAITLITKSSTEPYYIKRYALSASAEELAKAFQNFQSIYGFDLK